MNTLQVKYFMGAVESRSMSKAAESFFISQPAFSKHIRNLERELGIVLFKRSSSGVVLTEAGKLVYAHFTSMHQEFEMMLNEARHLSEKMTEIFRLGVPEDWDISRLALEVKQKFFVLHPNVAFKSFCQSNLITLLSRLKDNYFDVLFLPYVPAQYMEEVTAVRLTEVPMVMIMSKTNQLCERDSLRPEDFRNELFLVTGHEGFDIAKRSMYKYLEPYRFVPKIETRTSMSSVLMGVLNNEGVTLRDVWSLSINNPNLRYVELASTQKIYLAYRTANDSPILRDFIRLVSEHFSVSSSERSRI